MNREEFREKQLAELDAAYKSGDVVALANTISAIGLSDSVRGIQERFSGQWIHNPTPISLDDFK